MKPRAHLPRNTPPSIYVTRRPPMRPAATPLPPLLLPTLQTSMPSRLLKLFPPLLPPQARLAAPRPSLLPQAPYRMPRLTHLPRLLRACLPLRAITRPQPPSRTQACPAARACLTRPPPLSVPTLLITSAACRVACYRAPAASLVATRTVPRPLRALLPRLMVPLSARPRMPLSTALKLTRTRALSSIVSLKLCASPSASVSNVASTRSTRIPTKCRLTRLFMATRLTMLEMPMTVPTSMATALPARIAFRIRRCPLLRMLGVKTNPILELTPPIRRTRTEGRMFSLTRHLIGLPPIQCRGQLAWSLLSFRFLILSFLLLSFLLYFRQNDTSFSPFLVS